MPTGPKGEKRPADVIGNAVRVMQIATSEADETSDQADTGKDKAAADLGRRGGKARAVQEACWLNHCAALAFEY